MCTDPSDAVMHVKLGVVSNLSAECIQRAWSSQIKNDDQGKWFPAVDETLERLVRFASRDWYLGFRRLEDLHLLDSYLREWACPRRLFCRLHFYFFLHLFQHPCADLLTLEAGMVWTI
jgi:hypothetical protein